MDRLYEAEIVLKFTMSREAPNKKEFIWLIKEDFMEDYNIKLTDEAIKKIKKC